MKTVEPFFEASCSLTHPIHIGPTARIQPISDQIFSQSWVNLRNIAQIVSEVMGDRASKNWSQQGRWSYSKLLICDS